MTEGGASEVGVNEDPGGINDRLVARGGEGLEGCENILLDSFSFGVFSCCQALPPTDEGAFDEARDERPRESYFICQRVG